MLINNFSEGIIRIILALIVSISFIAVIFFKKRSKSISKQELEQVQMGGGEVDKIYNTIVNKIIFACDAGMGSSAMGASDLSKKLRKAGLNIEVINTAIEDIPKDAEIVITQKNLTARAKAVAPQAEHISITNFIDDPKCDQLIESLKRSVIVDKKEEVTFKQDIMLESNIEDGILKRKNIKLGLKSVDKEKAIEMAGQILVDTGYVDAEYIQSMKEREEMFSTYIGNGIAIPHGMETAKEKVNQSGIVILQFPKGVDFGDGNVAHLIIGVAGIGNDHLRILANIAEVIENEEKTNELMETEDIELIYNTLTKIS